LLKGVEIQNGLGQWQREKTGFERRSDHEGWWGSSNGFQEAGRKGGKRNCVPEGGTLVVRFCVQAFRKRV